ncbi:MAG: hypothetical protein WA063_05750 [Minisyncoccia bacterium]
MLRPGRTIFGLGGIYYINYLLFALISFVVFRCILIGVMLAGGFKKRGKFGLGLFAVPLLIMGIGLYH